ncbi:VOC family protein [Nocardioides sp. Leaf374]|uniref:VOC family protein n=1 Tax=Nocardioides sp. Leaf374 TaxID=2876560 RepID=UPI001E351E3A|nr:VOC family protein [Nocardioides sp. Leaf374]
MSLAGPDAAAVVREVQVTLDAADPRGLAGFWRAVLGYVDDEPPAGFDTWEAALEAWGVPPEERGRAWAVHDPTGSGPRLFFQRVPEAKTTKNRVHLDVRAAPGLSGEARMAALEAECERLVALGGSRLRRVDADGADEGIIVMADPEGNEFCLD